MNMQQGCAFWVAQLLLWIGLMSSSVVLGRDTGGSEPEPPWREFETELAERGFPTDTSSLIKLARSHILPEVRWLAIQILAWRAERDSIGTMRQLLRDDKESPFIRETAALALARFERGEGIAALRKLLTQQQE